MTSSSLARRLEEYEATIESLRLTSGPATRQVVGQESPAASSKVPRRRVRVGGIRIRDQGLRTFRVC
jgi:hypothetical protein